MFGSAGSMITRRAPRGEHGVWPRNTCVGVLPVQSDRVRPGRRAATSGRRPSSARGRSAGRRGCSRRGRRRCSTTLEMPREPWAPVATKIVVRVAGLHRDGADAAGAEDCLRRWRRSSGCRRPSTGRGRRRRGSRCGRCSARPCRRRSCCSSCRSGRAPARRCCSSRTRTTGTATSAAGPARRASARCRRPRSRSTAGSCRLQTAVGVDQAVRPSGPAAAYSLGTYDEPVAERVERIDRVVRAEAEPTPAEGVAVEPMALHLLPVVARPLDRHERDLCGGVRVLGVVLRAVVDRLAAFTDRGGRERGRLGHLPGQGGGELGLAARELRGGGGRARVAADDARDDGGADQREDGQQADPEPESLRRHCSPLGV